MAASKRKLSSSAKKKAEPVDKKKTKRARVLEYVEEGDESDKEYKVEEVLDEDDDKDDPRLLVKWVGYDQTTWEPKHGIPTKFYSDYCKKKKKGDKNVVKNRHKNCNPNNQEPKSSVHNNSKSHGRKTRGSKTSHDPAPNEVIEESSVLKSSDACYIDEDNVIPKPRKKVVEYEVEKVVDELDDKVLVKWVGFPELSWEPTRDIPPHFCNSYRESIRKNNCEHLPSEVDTDVPLLQEALDSQRLCAICKEEEESGRFCAMCKVPLHHMCWNELCYELRLEEVNDVSFCSKECYDTSYLTQSNSQDTQSTRCVPNTTNTIHLLPIANQTTKKQTLRLCVLCDEVERGARGCISCSKPVHRECGNEIIEELGVEEVRNTVFCSEKCYKQWKRDTDQLRKIKAPSKVPAKKSPKPPKVPNITTVKAKKKPKTSKSTSTDVDLDQVVGCNIAFSPNIEEWMSSKVYGAVGSLYLTGMVTRQMRNSNGYLVPDRYQVQWSATEFQGKDHVHLITHTKACEGKQNYDRMMGGHLKSTSWNKLCMPLEDSINIDADWDEFDELDESLVRYETNPQRPVDLAEVEKMKLMDFKTDAHIQAPDDLFRHDDGEISTRLTPEHRPLFEESASSAFLALLPLAFWRKVVENSNQYARDSKQPLVTLEEMMKFLGILFYISTVDKGEYSNYWGDQIENKMFGEVSSGLDRVMTLRRFKFIRQNFSFRNGVSKEELKTDPAARIRPIIKILRSRSPKFVQLGRNVAVDESSIACRSKYGRHMIVYNATKPTGKYHFKIYMMCCSETWFAVSFKLHCASELEKRLSGVIQNHEIETFRDSIGTTKPIRQHVLEVVMPINNTKRIVNTDNFYTSVQLLEALRVVGLYGRGTIRTDSKFGPKCIMLKKNDQVERGTIRQGVDVNHKMIGASWCDGSIVNMLSTADASTTTTVERTVGREKSAYPAPTCLREYNQFMQGVDRIDQLRSRFSIADGHTFKKWHKKLGFGYIDIARCNAYIARKMTGAYANTRDPHREFMIELSSELIHGGWQTAMGDNGLLFSEPTPRRTSNSPIPASPRPPSPARLSVACTFKHSRTVYPNKEERHKRKCVICRFEGRYASEQTVYCCHHKVSVCASGHQIKPRLSVNREVCSYICPAVDATCWDKFHSFYFPAGLFNVNGNIRRTCVLFKAMKDSQVRRRIPLTIDENQEDMPSETHRPNRSIIYENDLNSSECSSQSSSTPSTPMRYYQPRDSISDNSSMDLGVSPIPAPVGMNLGVSPIPAPVIGTQDVRASDVYNIRVGDIVQL